ncbi:MAG: GNAT family N-acetyltransferase [Gordonia sp. (in: high G+C Gram-positive bacteria)]|uniref:GNAT family N-acetyltransferase n=1 Tax=Gordonia sp. (in: high G+C Gram-positive bacteria) TaxID=84139 RepID=UPI0039E61FAB
MTRLDPRTLPVDGAAATTLAERGLDFRLIDAADTEALAGAYRAINRGFLAEEPGEEEVAVGVRDQLAAWRVLGVYDRRPQLPLPVATIAGWVTELTVPGGVMPMWAISEVTVAPTHRRRGIATAMLEGELRTAARAGLALAGLTVSEATIYRRFGFGPATFSTHWKVDVQRAGWAGPAATGALQFVDRDELARTLDDLHERTRRDRIGEIAGWPRRRRVWRPPTPA